MEKVHSAQELEALRDEIVKARDAGQALVTICTGTGCHAYGCMNIVSAFRDEIDKAGLSDTIKVRTTGCHGFCERGPLVVIYPQKIFYQRVQMDDVAEIVGTTLKDGEVIDRLLYTHPQTEKIATYEQDVPFYNLQKRVIFGDNGLIDPTSLEDYLAIGGYKAFAKVLAEMSPEDVLEEIKKSGLRGRGGGGFPTGSKWESCRKASGDKKYVICNADEGDPGAYMDRSLLEGNPHSVLEGMLIGAYAIGSDEGYIYVRNEYPLAVKHAEMAIAALEELGLMGNDILGSGFSFTLHINRGGGAFVCGESTALVASLEGKVGEPRSKYIHLAESGLWGKPTNLNNVETWANVPVIIKKGADWYSAIGTEGSKGTKIFSLVGKVNNTGLVEVPMGISLREIIFDIGGGIPDGKAFKAVQTGGPSGGCIPESLIDLPVDFDKLKEVGSMMGSGGMIVMDESTCMVDVAKYFVNFLKGESCGKCTPCREGLFRMSQILEGITEGRGQEGDIELLIELGEVMKDASLCGLGQTAPNPVLSTIKYFRDEYEAHIREKRCPAGVCKSLITYEIDPDKCTGCGACKRNCPVECITGEKKEPHTIDQKTCIKCGTCKDVCKFDAITVK
jgi:NADH-quinone oxidoreductase subunit F